MSKSLIIAEKPSVAADLARALGRLERKDEVFENDQYVISSAIGHLVELALPGDLDKKRGKWSFANLPVIPEEFALKPIEKTEDRFKLLKRLMKRADITEIINACDAGREGELIFRFLVKLADVHKPMRRLWLQSMTPDSIRQAFARLRSDDEMIPLAKAAFCRAESDWLVGINATRAMTAFNSKAGGFQLTPVGRVQTPTLAILVEREQKIRAFKPRTYFEVFGDFDVEAGSYRGRWFDEAFKRGGADEDTRAERLWDQEKADAIREKCLGKVGTVTEEKKPASQTPPLLFDLTSLQRDANGRFGFSARRTLQVAQQLYERHKVLTYPRTDSRYLPEDYLNTVKSTMRSFVDPALSVHADKALNSGWIRPTKRVFDNAKVSDHNAIIPTGEVPKGLDEAQQKIFDLVARRFIAVFFPAAQFEITTRITRVEGEPFKTDGRIIKDPGWMAVYGREAAAADGSDNALVEITQGEAATATEVEVKQSETKPPPRYNEATLLATMEGAGKLVDDEELRAALSAKGLGTPATRAAIIEGLILDNYIARQGRELVATAKGISLIALLRGIGIDALCSPEMTGEWEFKLKQIEQGGLRRKVFMEQIRGLTTDIVNRAKNFQGDSVEGDFGELDVRCPKCGARPLKEEYRVFRCPACDYVLWKTMAGRQFDPEEVKTLFTEGRIGPVEGFRSKEGRPFSASIKLGLEGKAEFDFPAAREIYDFSDKEPLCPCSVCRKGQVYAMEDSYLCNLAVGPEKSCTFRMSKTILQREIPPEQVVKMLTNPEGKTDLLTKFVSKKGRAFSAYLKLEKGKVTFEFEPRKNDKGKPGAADAKGKKPMANRRAAAKPKKAEQAPS
jgi:DNA topoisomerase-3